MRLYLKKMRKAAGLNQTQVAEKLGVTQACIAQIERGQTKQISTDLADKFAKIYGVDIRSIIAGESKYGLNQR